MWPPRLRGWYLRHPMKQQGYRVFVTLLASLLASWSGPAGALELVQCGDIQCGETQTRRLDAAREEFAICASAGELLSIGVSDDDSVRGFRPRWRLVAPDLSFVRLSQRRRRQCSGRCETGPLPETGVYRLRISESGRGRSDYTVSVDALSETANGQPNGPPSPACERGDDGTQPLAVGAPLAGAIEPRGESDAFTFRTDSAGALRIGLESLTEGPGVDLRVALFAPDGTRVPMKGGARECVATCDTMLATPGVHTLLVADGDDDAIAGYTLLVEQPGVPVYTTTTSTSTSTSSTSEPTSTTSTSEPTSTTSTTTTTEPGETTTTTVVEFELNETVEPPPAIAPEPPRLGAALVSDGQRLLIGAPRDDTAAPGAGAVQVVEVAGGLESLTFGRLVRTLLVPGTPGVDDAFGAALALASSGAIVVGAPGRAGTGAAYIFAGIDDTAPRLLEAPGVGAGARFGAAVAATDAVVLVAAPDAARGDLLAAGRVFVFDAATGALQGTLERPDAEAVDRFGAALAVAAGRVLVGAPGNGSRPGRALLFDAASGELRATLQHPDPTAGDGFGTAVAFVGDELAVGAPGPAGAPGSVVLFAADGRSLGPLERSGGRPDDRFGTALATTGDGLVVGAPGDSGVVPGGGAVYRYDVDVEPPELDDVLRKPTPTANDGFGAAVAGRAVVAAGDQIFVGAPGDDSGSLDGGGAYMFTGPEFAAVFRTRLGDSSFGTATVAFDGSLAVGSPAAGAGSGGVTLVDRDTGVAGVTLVNPGDEAGRFGYAVEALGEDLVVGAPFQPGPADTRAGAVFVFARDGGAPRLVLEPPTPLDGDQFGFALGTAGDAILVGAPLAGDRDTGVVHLYDGRSGRRRVTYRKPIPATGDFFGAAVAGDGEQVLVGAPLDEPGGAAYLFARDTAALEAVVRAPGFGGSDLFGAAVALAGPWIVVGAPMADAGAPHAGSVHVFERASGTLLRTIANPEPGANDNFGAAVSAAGTLVLVGAPFDDDGAVDTGSAHLFDLTTGERTQIFRNPPQAPFDHFGFSVALSPSGPLVGSPGPARVYLFAPAPDAPAAASRPGAKPRRVGSSRAGATAPRAAAGSLPPLARAPRCGDGLVEDAEECDDGNAIDTDDCRSDCTRGPCCVIDPRAQARCDDRNPCTDDVLDPVSGCSHVPNGSCCQADADCPSGECRQCVGCFLYEWDCCGEGATCAARSPECSGSCLDAALCRCQGKLDCGGDPMPDALTSNFARACDQLRLELSVEGDGSVSKAELTVARGRARAARRLLRSTARTTRQLAGHGELSRTCRRAVLEQVRTVKRSIPQGKRLRRCVLAAGTAG